MWTGRVYPSLSPSGCTFVSLFTLEKLFEMPDNWTVQYLVPPVQEQWDHRRRNYKTPIPKCPLHWCFCLRWCCSFVDSESESAAEYGLQHNSTPPHPPPPTNKHCLYLPYVYCGKGGEVGEVKEKVEGQQFTRGVENTNMTDITSL